MLLHLPFPVPTIKPRQFALDKKSPFTHEMATFVWDAVSPSSAELKGKFDGYVVSIMPVHAVSLIFHTVHQYQILLLSLTVHFVHQYQIIFLSLTCLTDRYDNVDPKHSLGMYCFYSVSCY